MNTIPVKVATLSPDMITYLEIAREVLNDSALTQTIVNRLDISNVEAIRLSVQLNDAMAEDDSSNGITL